MTPISAFCEHTTNTSMYPQVSPPQDTRRYRTPERDDEVMLAGRKKPVCQSCGLPMAGHKRPNGSPICPRDSTSTSPPPSPSPQAAYRSSKARARSETPVRYETPAPPPRSLLSRISPLDVRAEPTSSGYWRRQNPNWETPEHYTRLPRAPAARVPQRNATPGGSWQSTEPNESMAGTPPPDVAYYSQNEEEQDEEEDGEDTETQRSVSPAPSNQFTRFARHMASMLGRSSPVATEYSAAADEVFAIERAARKQGLYTRVVRRPLKPEPESPDGRLASRAQPIAQESSWRVFIGRDAAIVDRRAESHFAPQPRQPTPPREVLDLTTPEPYDYDKGLNKELNERVGTYPVDPRTIRQNFCDVIIAAVISAFCVVYFLSKL
ncbi:hypothetical protein PYCCODRAFT_1433407 [Trametes coccinea BRFM310]|uniref:Uncharacterized protein n=1 Tax=Trametes coccinea (strain BRFM310) TaxID=1353009 RepID=A0A1Y2ITR8_TRAC3|nr:hypothetical protein PYCCODRAFT_1433407 [Trametes coccinea BRFM310]